MPSYQDLIAAGQRPEYQEDKESRGTTVSIFQDVVLKTYSGEPHLITRAEQRFRFENELQAYQFFNQVEYPYVPKLIDYSKEDQWLCIERIRGVSLFDRTQDREHNLDMKKVIKSLDKLDVAL